MPSLCHTNVFICGDGKKLGDFLHNECQGTTCLFKLPIGGSNPIDYLGFDGLIINEDSEFEYSTTRKLLGISVPSLSAHYETKWTPPLPFFQKMANKYPLLSFHIEFTSEDESFTPSFGYFYIKPEENEDAKEEKDNAYEFIDVDDPKWNDVSYEDFEMAIYNDVQMRFNTHTCSELISMLTGIGDVECSYAQKMYNETFIGYCNDKGIHV